MLKYFGILTLIGGLALFGSCSSVPHASASLNYPLNAIYSAVEKEMTMGIRGYSENHREVFSKPFLVKQSADAKKKNTHERGLAKVSVLGDRRPYNLEVEIIIQRSKGSSGSGKDDYSAVRTDKKLAQELLGKIVATLQRQQQNNNLIDGFRSF